MNSTSTQGRSDGAGGRELFRDLRERNERRARIAVMTAAQRERRLKVERVVQVQRERPLRQAG